jgi:hypothetical protein
VRGGDRRRNGPGLANDREAIVTEQAPRQPSELGVIIDKQHGTRHDSDDGSGRWSPGKAVLTSAVRPTDRRCPARRYGTRSMSAEE